MFKYEIENRNQTTLTMPSGKYGTIYKAGEERSGVKCWYSVAEFVDPAITPIMASSEDMRFALLLIESKCEEASYCSMQGEPFTTERIRFQLEQIRKIVLETIHKTEGKSHAN